MFRKFDLDYDTGRVSKQGKRVKEFFTENNRRIPRSRAKSYQINLDKIAFNVFI